MAGPPLLLPRLLLAGLLLPALLSLLLSLLRPTLLLDRRPLVRPPSRLLMTQMRLPRSSRPADKITT